MPVPLEQFVKHLEDSGIIAGDTLRDFIPPKALPKDAEELARELIRKNKLTRFQAAEAYKGKASSLVLGNYVILDKIGAGGMGQVFKAEHRRMKRIVAVKTLPAGMMKNPAVVARFEREVTAAAKLNHPNIVTAFDADKVNDVHLLIMEYVEGTDLAALVKKSGPLPVEQALNYVLQTARGLEAAHAEGIVHRDIKPANLLLDKKGTVKILDMGLARLSAEADAGQAELTSTGTVMGTVDYMAPEQALNTKSADSRADIYSLGCSLYYLLTGKATYGGDTLMAKLLAHRDQPIPALQDSRPDVTEAVQALFCRMVAKKIDDRYQTMREVIADLESLGTGTGSSANVKPPSQSFADPGLTDFLKDIALTEAPPVVRKKKKKSAGPSFGKDNQKNLLIGGGLLGGLILLAGIVISLRTKDGTLVVTISEPDADVQVLSEAGRVEITKKGEQSPLTITVVPGKHQLQIRKEGFELYTDSFEIKSGGNESVTAKLVPEKKKPEIVENKKAVPGERPHAVSNEGDWNNLFDGKSLTGWTGEAGLLSVQNGVLVNEGKRGVVIAPGDHRDVEIEIEFRLEKGGNSGLGICYSGNGDPSREGLEIQMLDDEGFSNLNNSQKCGSIFSLAPVKPGHFQRWPQWNRFRVVSAGDDVKVELNGVLVTETTRSGMQKAHPQHAGILRTSGKVCLFPITSRSEYRNFRIRPVSQALVRQLAKPAPPGDAAGFNGHSYKVFPDVLSWHEAKTRCEELGGHLAIIESDAENNFVAGLVEKTIPVRGDMDGAWLGATDEHQEGDWKTVDGKSLEFTKWGSGQPNNKQNEEHYLMLWLKQREWSDQPTRSTQHKTYFICEWDVSPRPAATADPSVSPADAIQKDVNALQGEWVAIHEELNGDAFSPAKVAEINRRFNFKKDELHVTRTFNGTFGRYDGRFQVNPAGGEFDWAGTGPGGGQVKWKGIYQVTGDRLKVCFYYVENDQTGRPTAFKSAGQPAKICVNLELKRSP